MAGGEDAAKSSVKSSNKGSKSGGLQSFLQKDAAQNATKVDWENRSRGAYSTVSKMKSAVERMNKATVPAPREGAAVKEQQKQKQQKQTRTAVRKSKSDDAMDKLSSFLRKNAKSDDNIPSDDRSRGAHSTMSHNLKRTKKPLHQPSSKASDAFFATPSNVPQAAERKLPTGNPKARSTKSQKNLEMFMSRQAPLPKQDLEVRSAFTSVDRARSYTMKTVPVAPLPTNKEDLLNLLRTTSAMSPQKTDKPSVRASSSKIVLTQPLVDTATNESANSSNAARSAPATLGVRRTTSEDTASFNKKRTPPKRTRSKKTTSSGTGAEQQEKWLQQIRPTTTTSSDSPTKQFSNILPAQALLDKPQAFVPALPGPHETALMRSQSVNELSASNPLFGSSSTHASPVKAANNNKTGLAKTVHTTKASSRITNSTNTLGRTPKKKPSKSSNATTTASVSDDKKNTTSSKVMSARRLHHAPANSIPSSPIAGRRQSLKMGLAGTASGEGQKINKAAAAQRKKKKPTAAVGGSKKPQRQQQRSLKLPMTPDIHDDAENNEAADAATKKRTTKTSSTGGGGGSSSPPRMPQRRKSADDEPVPPSSRSKTTGQQPGRRRGGEALEDNFSFYTWSEARQPAGKIMKERQVLRDAIMDGGPLHRAYNRIT